MNPTTKFDQKSLVQPEYSIQKPATSRNVSEQIRSITVRQIELIGLKMSEQVVKRLGPIARESIVRQVAEKKGAFQNEMMHILMLQNQMLRQSVAESGEEKFLSDKEKGFFLQAALNHFKERITASFSMPQDFLDSQLAFKLSEYEPMGILKEVASNVKIALSLVDVPCRYYISLKLDQELTQKKADLVFTIIEESEDVEFSKISFTITDLEKSWSDNLHKYFVSKIE